jgi:hypothetical protein
MVDVGGAGVCVCVCGVCVCGVCVCGVCVWCVCVWCVYQRRPPWLTVDALNAPNMMCCVCVCVCEEGSWMERVCVERVESPCPPEVFTIDRSQSHFLSLD